MIVCERGEEEREENQNKEVNLLENLKLQVGFVGVGLDIWGQIFNITYC